MQADQAQLLHLIRTVVPNSLLLQLLTGWLGPAALPVPGVCATAAVVITEAVMSTECSAPSGPSVVAAGPPSAPFECCGLAPQCAYNPPCNSVIPSPAPHAPPSAAPLASRPPLNDIIHIHRSICSALEGFLQEARQLRGGGGSTVGGTGSTGIVAPPASSSAEVSGSQLQSLVERHRFLRSVCLFHTASEEEVRPPSAARTIFP